MRRERESRLFENPFKPHLRLEQKFQKRGFQLIAGVDEVGRGPLAGPVIAGAVILPSRIPSRSIIWQVRDSKLLNGKKRQELFQEIMERALAVGVGEASPEEIDRLNIFQASLLAMERAVKALKPEPDFCLVDGIAPLNSPPSLAVKKGDKLCLSIACASIIAKVVRDERMCQYHQLYPEYNFARNKGYATREHKEALYKYGPCPIHRKSFLAVKISLERRGWK